MDGEHGGNGGATAAVVLREPRRESGSYDPGQTPTGQQYEAFSAAFEHFNGALFDNTLPAVLRVLDPGTTEALRRWKLICPSQVWVFRVFPAEAVPRFRRDRRGDHMAIGSIALHLRTALETADVERRDQLYQRDACRLRLRAHDLRATFITLALAQGRSEDWVRTRTGHRTSQMIARYRREATTAQELELGWLHPLHEVIPELAALGPQEPSPERELSANCRHPRESAPDASGATLH